MFNFWPFKNAAQRRAEEMQRINKAQENRRLADFSRSGALAETVVTRTMYVRERSDAGDLGTSMAIALATDNAALGHAVGGDMSGALLGFAVAESLRSEPMQIDTSSIQVESSAPSSFSADTTPSTDGAGGGGSWDSGSSSSSDSSSSSSDF